MTFVKCISLIFAIVHFNERGVMQLTHLHYFRVIARCGNLTHAARQLGVQQSTLSVAMQRLEAEMHTTLLLRDRSGVTLTSTGRSLLPYVTEALALLEAGAEHVQGLETEDIGSFVLGVPMALGSYFLPAFLRTFQREAPRIELSLWTGTSLDTVQALVARDIHFGLVINPPPHPELVFTELYHDATDFFVAGSLLPATQPTDTHASPPVTMDWETACARLRAGPLVYVTYMAQAHTLRQRLGALQLLPAQLLRCDDLALAQNLAMAGVGVAILPRRVAASSPLLRLWRLHPALPFVHDVVYLAYRADVHRTRAAMRLKDALVAYGRSLRCDEENQRLQQEGIESELPKTPGREG
jgi:DNA-binding transcriptional LysR family regulator